jgi:CheY-like chemotaxis protein
MILVVDHDIAFLDLASRILNRDRQVFLASDAQKAFQLVNRLGFSVALVDLDFKGNDGLSLIQGLRESFPDLPIIAISSVVTAIGTDVAEQIGAVEVLRKPITAAWKPIVERVRATGKH